MIDWMVEVLNTFHCSNETFFHSVAIFDSYLQRKAENGAKFNDDDVHVIGVCSMLAANKFE